MNISSCCRGGGGGGGGGGNGGSLREQLRYSARRASRCGVGVVMRVIRFGNKQAVIIPRHHHPFLNAFLTCGHIFTVNSEHSTSK
jgi:hypothetical protein